MYIILVNNSFYLSLRKFTTLSTNMQKSLEIVTMPCYLFKYILFLYFLNICQKLVLC